MLAKTTIATAVALSTIYTASMAEVILPDISIEVLDKKKDMRQKLDKLQKEFEKKMKLTEKEAKKVDQEMKKILLSKNDDETIKLLVALPKFDDYKVLYDELQMSSGTYSNTSDNVIKYTINGKESTKKEIEARIQKKDQAIQAFLTKQNIKRKETAKKIHTYLKENKLISSLDEEQEDYAYFTVALTKKEGSIRVKCG